MRQFKGRRYQRGFWNFVIPAIAAVASAALGKEGQSDANDANLQIARENQAFNAQEAEKTREFQLNTWNLQTNWSEQMANTQYQRAVGDLRAAGLNPMLAYSQGGAPMPTSSGAPQGATASSSVFPRQESTAIAGLNAAATALQLQNMQKQGDNIDADTALKQAQAGRETASAGELNQRVNNLRQDMEEQQYRMANIRQDTMNKFQRQELLEAETELTRLKQRLTTGEIGFVDARERYTRVLSRLASLEIPGMENIAAKERTTFGEAMPYLKDVGSLANSAAGAALRFRGLRALGD